MIGAYRKARSEKSNRAIDADEGFAPTFAPTMVLFALEKSIVALKIIGSSRLLSLKIIKHY